MDLVQVQKVHTQSISCTTHAKNAANRVKGAFKHIKMLSRGKLLPQYINGHGYVNNFDDQQIIISISRAITR